MAEMSIAEAIQLMQSTADALLGRTPAEIALWYDASDRTWSCTIDIEITAGSATPPEHPGEPTLSYAEGERLRVQGTTPQDAIHRCATAAWRRVGSNPPD